MHARHLQVLTAAAFCIVGFMPIGQAQDPCVPTSADPATINEVDNPMTGEIYYVEERDSAVPTSPPIPGSGFVAGNGTRVYEEANGLPGLQRGGVDFLGDEDPIVDESCGAGPDTHVSEGRPANVWNAVWEAGPVHDVPRPRAVYASFSRASHDDPILAHGSPDCTFTIGENAASVVCGVGSTAICTNPGLGVSATSGTVTGSTNCAGSDAAQAIANGPGAGGDIVLGLFAFPWSCFVSFESGATGSVFCDAPDP